MAETVTAFADAEVTDTGAFSRQLNQGLMVAWINADLLNRASHDVRKSIVLYDVDGDFTYAAGSKLVVEGMWPELWAAGVRSWSRGIV
jgi:hypothetical protein